MTPTRMVLAFGLAALGFAAQAQTAARSTYIVQLADVPAAAYSGTVAGYAATKPAAGKRLNVNAATVQAYIGYLDAKRNAALSTLGTKVPVVYKYNLAFNGFAARLTAAEAQKLKANPGVLAVSLDRPRTLDTTRTPAFLGLSGPGGLWSKLDASSRPIKGEDVVIGIVDSGIWPEDPAFSDKVDASGKPVAPSQPGTVAYGPPPAGWSGTCVAGPGFPATACNHKLIGARFYRDGFDAAGLQLTPLEYASPRDGDGHGSHTASTAGGNDGVDALLGIANVGTRSGMAPRARIAAYKVCWNYVGGAQATCFGSDSVAAIDDAVADGVNAINFSISGAQTDFLDGVELAFLFAADAGVFVAASAGNSGPANAVAHMSPWLTTVAASTHDRVLLATATLGNAATYTGSSLSTGVPKSPLILSTQAALNAPFDDTNTEARLCFLGALDPAKVAGKVVVCDRGTNARVEKSQEVAERGGVGMLLVNVTPADLVEDIHSVPTVHLQSDTRAAIRAYAAGAGATASLSPFFQKPDVIAPIMASFSSRGPNLATPAILKPDISAPGVNVIAAYLPELSQAQHDGVIAGTFTPPSSSAPESGTSMSSPHIAGISALIKQLHPNWSPAAIKSALMTSAGPVKLADGSVDPDRFGYGAGHVNPNGAAATSLVYDAGYDEYVQFLCGVGALNPAGATCRAYGSVLPWNLNLPSLSGNVVGKISFNRSVTNKSAATATYNASTTLPGFDVAVVPPTLSLLPGQTRSFRVDVTRTTAPLGAWTFGDVVWNDGTTSVRSPLSVRPLQVSAPAELTDDRAAGTKVFTVGTGYNGKLVATAVGLAPAERHAGTVATGEQKCFNLTVPSGALHARFSLFNADTDGGAKSDLDLEVRLGGVLVGSSGSGTSDEEVNLVEPDPGVYQACVIGYAPLNGSANFTLSNWSVTPTGGTGNFRAAAPAKVFTAGTASVAAGWAASGGRRYLGIVQLSDGVGPVAANTLVSIDASARPASMRMGAGSKAIAKR